MTTTNPLLPSKFSPESKLFRHFADEVRDSVDDFVRHDPEMMRLIPSFAHCEDEDDKTEDAIDPLLRALRR